MNCEQGQVLNPVRTNQRMHPVSSLAEGSSRDCDLAYRRLGQNRRYSLGVDRDGCCHNSPHETQSPPKARMLGCWSHTIGHFVPFSSVAA